MNNFLQTMAASSAERAAAADSRLKTAEFDQPVVALALGEFDVIAEIKDRSPAEGNLAEGDVDRSSKARHYANGGAAAISVLTEPSKFDGALKHLEEVVAALVEPVQILEARNAGASGVLLIAAILDKDKLQEMFDCAWDHGMFVLLESFDEEDLSRVSRLLDTTAIQDKAQSGQLLVGVNTRDLRTLHVDPDRLSKLAPALPAAPCVAESGLYDADDVAAVASLGYRLALVGTALMRSDDPASLVAAMRVAGSASAVS